MKTLSSYSCILDRFLSPAIAHTAFFTVFPATLYQIRETALEQKARSYCFMYSHCFQSISLITQITFMWRPLLVKCHLYLSYKA
jgi:hypothetical protein